MREVEPEACEVLVLADTHLTAERTDRLPERVWELARDADVILHAGDVTSAALLQELGALAPVVAVLGNNDHDLGGRLPLERCLSLGGVEIALVHDSGARGGRATRLHRRFPGAKVVVFGHSHEPVAEWTEHGQLLFNPGSAVQRRRALHRTAGRLRLARGEVLAAEHVVV